MMMLRIFKVIVINVIIISQKSSTARHNPPYKSPLGSVDSGLHLLRTRSLKQLIRSSCQWTFLFDPNSHLFSVTGVAVPAHCHSNQLIRMTILVILVFPRRYLLISLFDITEKTPSCITFSLLHCDSVLKNMNTYSASIS